MYAVVEISGKQFKVEEGRFIDIDLQNTDSPDFTFDKVLLVSKDGNIKAGSPFLAGASIKAKLIKDFKDKKVLIFKQRPKKGTRLKQGHRQQYTRVMIEKIEA
ncbi:MAG: 50S ribosomal protein L21 [Proteobacteria bacterium]|jgi:large subunit ribosomal protein L21|nr:50S ribosomal protein L21 [Pseudomonadota bacterium]